MFLIFTSVIAIGLSSCKEASTTENSAMNQVMAIHDEAMPKMSKIGSLVAELRKKIDNDEGGATEKKAMEDLQDAHKTMMEWMRGFGGKFDSEEILDGKELTPEKQALLKAIKGYEVLFQGKLGA